MITTERYFRLINTPKIKNGSSYHLYVCIAPTKRQFEGNFIRGTEKCYYKKNITSKTLNGLLKKIYRIAK